MTEFKVPWESKKEDIKECISNVLRGIPWCGEWSGGNSIICDRGKV